MLRVFFFRLAAAALITAVTGMVVYPAAALKPGALVPDITLSPPPAAAFKKYLGWGDAQMLKLSGVRAEVVVVDVFSMYCPYCQKDAPSFNRLYRLIQSRLDLKDRVKILGIGVGNSPFEVELFRKTYKVPFPLFPDENRKIHHFLGQVRTPHILVIKNHPDGRSQVVIARSGRLTDVVSFLEYILQSSDLT